MKNLNSRGMIAVVVLVLLPVWSHSLSMRDGMSRRGVMNSLAASSSSLILGTNHANAATGAVGDGSILKPAANPGARAAYVGQTQVGDDDDWNPKTNIVTKLGMDRILNAKELSGLSNSGFLGGDREVYYPDFLFGSWNVTSTLKRKIYPYGTPYVYSSFVQGSPRNRREQVGDSTTFESHYISTLANTMSNQMTVNLGLGVPKSKIIADRKFNALSLNQAYQHLIPLTDVLWDPSTDPTRLTLQFATMTKDLQPMGQRKGEVYLTSRQTELTDDETSFCVAERSRTTSIAQGDVTVTDLETITEYTLMNDDDDDKNHVQAISRIAVFLTPNPNSREGLLWQQVGGNAVAFFDYQLDMHRILEPFDETIIDNDTKQSKTIRTLRPCVTTYKDVRQCQ